MVSNIDQGAGGGIYEMLRSMQKEQEAMLEEASAAELAGQSPVPVASQHASTQTASSNLLSRNFATAEREESKYVNATLNRLSVDKQLQTQATNRVTALLNTLGGIQGPKLYDGTGSKGGIPEATIQLAVKRIQNVETQEESERNLEEIKKSIERKAQEVAAPKDENGEPIDGLASGSAGEAASMPEIRSPGLSSMPQASVAATPDAVSVEVPAASVSISPASSASESLSIDITV